jgi:hypothetical protein
VLFDPNRNANLIVTQALQGEADNKLSVLLDIDVFRAASFAVGEDEMWVALEDFRNLKNDAFFDHVTDKLLDQYA